MSGTVPRRGGRLAVGTAVAGTVLIAAGAFWLSFTALADLAGRSGIDEGQAWAWPLIVDGIIVVATVAVVALAGTRTSWYPWLLLICGAALSVTANSIHAIVAADADVPAVLAASVAAVPPLVLLAITHLTVILTRPHTPKDPDSEEPEPDELGTEAEQVQAAPEPVEVAKPELHAQLPAAPMGPASNGLPGSGPGAAPGQGGGSGREMAEVLRAGGWSNKKIARHLDVHPSTVGRWFPQTTPTPAPQPEAGIGRPAVESAFEASRDEEELS